MLSIPNFADRLCGAVRTKKSILCCGLDPQLRYMPPQLIAEAVERYGLTFGAIRWLYYEFNHQIIDAIHDVAVCVKPQMAFYEAYGHEGVRAFEQTVSYARRMGLLVIEDAKRGDGGDTADAYADGYLGQVPFFGVGEDPAVLLRRRSPVCADCMTIHAYIGLACVDSFVRRIKEFGTGVFVVTKTSFKPNSDVEQLKLASGIPVWQALASLVNEWGEGTEGACGLRNVGVVMGATYPADAVEMRKILPNAIFLIPGYGSQGGAADEAVVGIRNDGFGGVVNSSRGLTYAYCDKKGKYQCDPEKFADAARSAAIGANTELVDSCRKAGKWPHW